MRLNLQLVVASAWIASIPSALADRIVLKDGFELSGALNIDQKRITVRTDLKTYFVAAAELLKPEVVDSSEPPETYSLKQPILRTGRQVESVSYIAKNEPFDQFGRRTIQIQDNKGKLVPVHQGITEVYPTHVIVEGINCVWRSAVALSDIPADNLLAILLQATDSSSLPANLKLAGFLLQARMYVQARQVHEDVRKRFPDAASQLEPLAEQLRASLSRDGLALAERAMSLGQLTKSQRLIDEFKNSAIPPTDVGAWNALADKLAQIRRDVERARSLIANSIDALPASARTESIVSAAREAAQLVSSASIDRLRPLLVLADQPETTAEARVALAVSGWIVGANLAQKDFSEAARLVERRALVTDVIKAPTEEEFEIRLDALRSSGVSADMVAQMIPLLPAPAATIAPGRAAVLEANAGGAFHVYLPPEYDPTRGHPLLVTLHGQHSTPEQQIDFWKSSAAAAGMIVVAPDYLLGKDRPYEYSIEEHEKFLAMLADVRKRFAVDSNRVYLGGHDIGAFAAFDLGMSHPDEFAGLVTFSGVPMFYAQYYWRNVAHLPIYAVEGQLNGGNPGLIRSQFDRLFLQGHPAIYVEYSGRGGGMFPSELPRILDWMGRKVRDPFPHEVEAASARHCDRRFYWIEADAFMPGSTIAPKLFDRKKGLKPAKMSGSLTAGNTLDIQSAGLKSVQVLVSPQLLQIDDPKLTVKLNRKVIHSGPIVPDLGVLLRTVRQSGDKQRIVVKVLLAST